MVLCLVWFQILLRNVWSDQNVGKSGNIPLWEKVEIWWFALVWSQHDVLKNLCCISYKKLPNSTSAIFTTFFSKPFLKKSRYPSPSVFFRKLNFMVQTSYHPLSYKKLPSGTFFLKAISKICGNRKEVNKCWNERFFSFLKNSKNQTFFSIDSKKNCRPIGWVVIWCVG